MAQRQHIEYDQTIERLERMQNSTEGNPRYRLHFTDGSTAEMQKNAMVGYALGPRYVGVPVHIKATPGGQVWSVEIVEDSGEPGHAYVDPDEEA